MAPKRSLPNDVTLCVIRHGETDWNAEFRYQGQADIPLNSKGHAQARRNGRALAEEPINAHTFAFISSPLIRARRTMELVRLEMALPDQDYAIDPLLQELSYGHWEGVLQSDLPSQDPEGLAKRNQDPFHWRPDGGESYADLVERTDRWLQSVKTDTVIAAHGGTLRCLHALLLNLPDDEVPNLKVPQDRVLIVKGNHGRWI